MLSPLAQKYKDAFDGRMIVFDIDGLTLLYLFIVGTLWWFWMDTHPDPPVKPSGMGFVDA